MSEFVKVPLWFNVVAFLLFSWTLGGCASLQPKKVISTHTEKVGNTVTLFDEPCTDEHVIKFVPAEFRHLMKDADGTYEGKAYDLCYTELPPGSGDVVLVWEDGGIGGIQGVFPKRTGL
jgi:hypothetical protein